MAEWWSKLRGMVSSAASEDAITGGVTAAGARAAAWLSVVGMAILVIVLIFVQMTFEPLVTPAWHLDAWLAWMAGTVVYWAGLMLMYLRRKPDDAELARVWTPLGRLVQTAMNIGIAVSPWALLLNADPALRSLMTVLYVWFMATEIMTGSESIRVPVWEIAMMTASTVAFVLWTAPPYAEVQAFFLTMIGLTMLGLRRLIRRGVEQALTLRLLSEAAEAATRDALASAEAARDAKTRFIASASHDLQQPLQAAALFFENAVATGDAAARARAVGGARAAFASTQGLIRQMLDHLRLEAGAVRARLERVALGPLIAEVAGEHELAARGAGMRLIALPCRLAVTADAALLRRAIGNLVANAVRHAAGERVLIGARAAGDTVALWVIDDGRGIPATDAARLFEDYAQGSDNATRGGFGLGLASVRRSARLMDGDASLDPRWTGGAAFRLTLPRATPLEVLCEAA